MAKEVLLISVQDNLSVMGLRFIHNALLRNGNASRILFLPYFDARSSRTLEKINAFVRETDPLFIGISLMSIEYYKACALSEFLKLHYPSIPVVWGGTHPTVAPETCFPHADYVCLGEGERTALDLAAALEKRQDTYSIPNLCYREKGNIRKNGLYPLIEDLDGLPPLGYIGEDSFLQERRGNIAPINKALYEREARYKGRMYEIITSRGCAFACSYCCNSFFSRMYGTRSIRRRRVDNIIAELEDAIKTNPKIALIHIQDDSFLSASMEYIEDFCRAYKENIKRPLMAHAIPVYLNLNKLELLKNAGLAWINMGLQSGSDRVLTEIYRRNSLRTHFLEAATAIHRLNIAGKYDVIVDNPFESEDETVETVETVARIPKPYLLEIYSLRFFPGTELYEKAVSHVPDQLGHYRQRDYLRVENSALNRMILLAVYLPKPIMDFLVRLYKAGRASLPFTMTLAACSFLSRFFYRPLIMLEVYLTAHRYSPSRAIANTPLYIREMLLKNF